MLAVGTLLALVGAASAGYSSSSSGGAGLYNSNTYDGQTYGPKYPYSNQYSGYAGGANAFPFYQPAAPFATPYDFQNAFQQYYNQLSSFNAKHLTTSYAGDGAAVSATASLGPSKYNHKKTNDLYNQQLAHQQAVFNSIRNQAYGGGGDGAAYGGAAYGGAGSFAGGSTGSFGGAGPAGNYGGTYGGNSHTPNYASAGGAVGNGYQQQHANIYPANAGRPNLDSRFGGDDSPVGVSHSQGQPGFVGVSSFSSSSDINGVKNRESATSVNNNGKVTTYHVRNR